MLSLDRLFCKLDCLIAFVKNHILYQVCRKKMGFPYCPVFGDSDTSFLSISELFIPPVTFGMNSMEITLHKK